MSKKDEFKTGVVVASGLTVLIRLVPIPVRNVKQSDSKMYNLLYWQIFEETKLWQFQLNFDPNLLLFIEYGQTLMWSGIDTMKLPYVLFGHLELGYTIFLSERKNL